MILTHNQLALENSLRRILPAGVVSCWIPDGQNRAKDIIRCNHGQCHGTHPNVLVLPSLIDPTLGWHFDGTDDYVEIADDTSLRPTKFSFGFWIKPETMSDYKRWLGKVLYSTDKRGWMILRANSDRAYLGIFDANSVEKTSPSVPYTVNEWTNIAFTFDGTYMKSYKNGALVGISDSVGGWTFAPSTESLKIGKGYTASYFTGHIALPFIANTAWSLQQIKSFYNATKGLFYPRG